VVAVEVVEVMEPSPLDVAVEVAVEPQPVEVVEESMPLDVVAKLQPVEVAGELSDEQLQRMQLLFRQ
jgi:hypothetical protein